MSVIERLNRALSGRYSIERELGEGGMATVYLADDVRHERRVALKVLKPELAAVIGADRFLAEIKTTANLQHPHILPLFDSGEADGFLFFVMPFIEGESLAERLGREKQLPVEDAIRLGTEIGDALDYAHRRGVVHRDIKPANVLLHDGRALVADFGIAVAVTAAGGSRLTETGLSLGTPAYMSPEQATGDREVDGRTDIYSLGCLLYEMLTGQPPHLATTAQAVLAKVLTSDPEPISQHRKTVPRHVEAAIHKAMARLPADRFGGAAELSSALKQQPSAQPLAAHETAEALTGRFPVRGAFAALALFALGMTAAAVWGWTRTTSTSGVRHVTIPPPTGLTFVPGSYVPALSPDGSTVVFAARAGESTMLYRRPIDGFEAEPIEGTDDAEYAFFSPDGEWLAFFTRLPHLMKKVPLTGGDPILITPLNVFRNDAVWMSDGSIVFSWERQGLWTVSADGGRPTQLTRPDGSAGEVEHVRPQELRDGRLFFAVEAGGSLRSAVLDLGTGERELLPGNLGGIYHPNGVMIVQIGDTWHAQSFDLRTGKAEPPRIPVLQGAPSAQAYHSALSLSLAGDIAYFSGTDDIEWIITGIDTLGAATPLRPDGGRFRWPRVSPDGRTLLINDQNDQRMWTLDLVTRVFRPFPVEEGWPGEQTWSADGRRIAYTIESDRDRAFATIYARNADGTGSAQVLAAPPFDAWTSSWSSDGRYLAFYGGLEQLDIWVQDLERDTLHQVTSVPSAERHPDFSPDGRWIAYQSDESNRNEIWVRGFPDFERRYPISIDGGTEPIWAANGRELFFRNGSQIMVVEYAADPTFNSSPPRELLRTFLEDDSNGDVSYSVMPDDRTFVILRSDPRSSPELRVIKDWVSDVKRRTGR